MSAAVHTIPVERLRAAVHELMKGFGSAPREIELVADNLIQANLTGHDSHGVGMLPRYADAFLEGGLKANATATGNNSIRSRAPETRPRTGGEAAARVARHIALDDRGLS